MEANQDIVIKTYHGILFEDLFEDLIKEIELRNYRITQISNIDNILKYPDGQRNGFHIGFQHYKIIEFCNLNSCAELIASDMRAGVFMPVRFVIYQPLNQNQINIAFLKPNAFAKLFGSQSLTRITNMMEKEMNHVLEELEF